MNEAGLSLSALEWEALRLSLLVATVATLAGLAPAILLAHVLARRDFPGKFILDAIIHLPLVMPPVVTGYLLLMAFGRQGPIGAFLHDIFGLTFSFRWTGAALAAFVMGLPLAVRAIRLSIEAVDREMERAAASLGAPPWRVFLFVTLPLSLPGIIAGAILMFARGLGEFGATVTFVSNIPGETQTIPNAIHALLQVPGEELAVLRLTLISIAVALAALIASEILSRRAYRRLNGQPTPRPETFPYG